MSLTLVRPYFSNKLKALKFGEHLDAFNLENIAHSNIDRAFHYSMSVSNNEIGQSGQQLTVSVTIRLFFKGYLNMANAYDEAVKKSQEVILSIMDKETRFSSEGLKSIEFQSMSFDPYSSTNDNIIQVTQEYTAQVYLCY